MPSGYIRDTKGNPRVELVDATARASMHTHTNKTVLDGITAEDVKAWSEISGSIPTDTHINGLIDAKLGVIENGTY